MSKEQEAAHRTTEWLGYGHPLILDSGYKFDGYRLAYDTYGDLNRDRSNAILVCHALTGDQYVARENPETGTPGWWTDVVGPGKAIDTDKYFVICSNVLGGCMGSIGPSTIDDRTGKRLGLSFPVITIGDMVKTQAELIKLFDIKKLMCVVGGSMGGMQALEWLRLFPSQLQSAIVIASSCRQSSQNMAFQIAGREAIMKDPAWHNGEYLEKDAFPDNGLALARMIAHITYLSSESLDKKFGRRLQDRSWKSFEFKTDFQTHSYLKYQGEKFTKRFDPNSYLYITLAIDYMDQSESAAGDLAEVYRGALEGEDLSVCLISFTSDWMYPTKDSIELKEAFSSAGVEVDMHELETEHGHDSFLLKNEEMESIIREFVDRIAKL